MQAMTQRLSVTAVRQQWSNIVDKVFRRETQIVLEKSGIPVAVIISPEDYRRLQQLDAQRVARFRAIDRLSDAFSDVTSEVIERDVAKALSEGRATQRRRAASTG